MFLIDDFIKDNVKAVVKPDKKRLFSCATAEFASAFEEHFSGLQTTFPCFAKIKLHGVPD